MKILVIQQKMIGDVLASSIICNNLKMLYPTAQIDYLIYPFTKPVVENNPNISNIILFEEEYRKSKKAFLQFLIGIRKTKYDIVIDSYGKLESNLVVALSQAKIKIGMYKSYTRFVYTETVYELKKPLTNAGIAIENRLNLLHSLSKEIPLDNKPMLFLTDAEIQKGKEILTNNKVDLSKTLLMIGVLGSGITKTLPFESMAQVLDFIVDKTDASLLFNYMPSQKTEAKAIFDLCKPATQSNIKIGIVPGNIREFLSITKQCNALIGNEGGAVNMAKALNIPTFTVFSPWIRKEAWNSFEDGKHHVSVHLKDFKPDLYGDKNPKEMKNKALQLYQEFEPELIFPILGNYLNTNSKDSSSQKQIPDAIVLGKNY
jgi:heptosyltransferase-2